MFINLFCIVIVGFLFVVMFWLSWNSMMVEMVFVVRFLFGVFVLKLS